MRIDVVYDEDSEKPLGMYVDGQISKVVPSRIFKHINDLVKNGPGFILENHEVFDKTTLLTNSFSDLVKRFPNRWAL